MTETEIQRFWVKVRKTETCWIWDGMLTQSGYGRFRVLGRRLPSHRIAWTLQNGPIPEGLRACHRCDVPRCVRPEHLFLGTDQDNARDREAKGRRNAIGAKNGRSKLNPEAVRAIRVASAAGSTVPDLARQYGVDPTSIRQVVNGKCWRHVA